MDATANAFTQPCDVFGPAAYIGTLEELECADLHNKIAVLYRDLAKERFFPRAFTMYQPDGHVTILRLLEEKQPLAIVWVYKIMQQRLSIVTDWQFRIPSVTVTPEMGLQLLQHPREIRVQIDSQTQSGDSKNVIGRTPGAVGKKRIVICAHYDTHFESLGACDNGTGVAVMLTLARSLTQTAVNLEIGLEFIAFSGEEYAALGDQAYLATQPDFGNIVVVINVDGVGQALGNTTITAMGTSEYIEAELRRVKSEFPGVTWVEPWYASNHTTFVFQGVPAIPIASLGVENLIDGPQDELKWVSREKLAEAVCLVEQIVQVLRK